MKGILMKDWAVRALLDNRKTVTRRVVKDAPNEEGLKPCKTIGFGYGLIAPNSRVYPIKPPYRPGDILYVRETFTKYQTVNYIRYHDGRASSEVSDGQFAYKADGYGSIDDLKDDIRLFSDRSFEAVEVWDDKWHPSIHMPREAARIFLRVTNVYPQQLKDVTEEDAIAEGFRSRAEFMSAILKMYPGCTDDSWFWANEFERISREEAEHGKAEIGQA